MLPQDNPNRYRVSATLTVAKAVILISLSLILAYLVDDIINGSLTGASLLNRSAIILLGSLFYYYVRTRKIIEYDDIKHVLYIHDQKMQLRAEVPVENVDKILFSTIALNWTRHSYIIIYRDFNEQKQKVRIFPIAFRNDIDTIIADTRLKNPALKTRNWSIGWNEFFD